MISGQQTKGKNGREERYCSKLVKQTKKALRKNLKHGYPRNLLLTVAGQGGVCKVVNSSWIGTGNLCFSPHRYLRPGCVQRRESKGKSQIDFFILSLKVIVKGWMGDKARRWERRWNIYYSLRSFPPPFPNFFLLYLFLYSTLLCVSKEEKSGK